MSAIRVMILKEELIFYNQNEKRYVINIEPSTEFMMEPFIKFEDKCEIIAQALKEEFYNHLIKGKLNNKKNNMTILEVLKEKFKKIVIKPEFSGKTFEQDILNNIINQIDSAKSLDEFEKVLFRFFGVRQEDMWKQVVIKIDACENAISFEEIIKKAERKLNKIKELKREAINLMAFEAAAQFRDMETKLTKAIVERNLQDML